MTNPYEGSYEQGRAMTERGRDIQRMNEMRHIYWTYLDRLPPAEFDAIWKLYQEKYFNKQLSPDAWTAFNDAYDLVLANEARL